MEPMKVKMGQNGVKMESVWSQNEHIYKITTVRNISFLAF